MKKTLSVSMREEQLPNSRCRSGGRIVYGLLDPVALVSYLCPINPMILSSKKDGPATHIYSSNLGGAVKTSLTWPEYSTVHPSKYYPHFYFLNFSDWMGTGAFNTIRRLA